MNKTKELNRKNNLLDQQIWENNQEIYGNMICYIRGADISDHEVEMVRQDLIEMILSAQSRGEDISSLFHGDYKQFCDDVIDAIPPKTKKEKIVYTLDIVFLCLSILVGIHIFISKEFIGILKALFTHSAIDWTISVSLGSMISAVVITAASVIVVQRICKRSFVEKESRLWWIGGAIALGIVYVTALQLGRSVVFTIDLFAACAVGVLFFVIHKLLESMDARP